MSDDLAHAHDSHELGDAVARLAHRRGHVDAAQREALRSACRRAADGVERHLETQGLSALVARELADHARALVARVDGIAGTSVLASAEDRSLRDGLARGVLDRRRLLLGLIDEASGGDPVARLVMDDSAGQATVVEDGSRAAPPTIALALHSLGLGRPTLGSISLPSRDGPCIGRYPVTSRLGAGGMGEVYAVFDPDLGREVAAKVIRGEVDARYLRKFVLEAQITGQLQHPSIVPVHELGRTPEGQLYFTMKKIEGRTLAAMLAADRADDEVVARPPSSAPLWPSTAPSSAEPSLPQGASPHAARRDRRLFERIGVMLKVCEAVGFAHSKGVIHRDLKPDNVMIGEFGEVLVCDWGLAKVLAGTAPEDASDAGTSTSRPSAPGAATLAGDVMGTPAYMPPEQALGNVLEVDERVDIYALGAMLYQVLSGEPPYAGHSASAVLEQVIAGPPTPLAERTSSRSIPWELQAVVGRAMEREPERRYASVTALRADLDAFLGGRLVAAAHYSPLQRATKLARRHARALSAIAVAVVSIVAASIYVAVSARAQLEELRIKEQLAVAAESRAQASLADAQRMGALQQLRDIESDALALWWTRLDDVTGLLRDVPDAERLAAIDVAIDAWQDAARRLLDQTDELVAAAQAAARDRDRSPKDTWFAFRARVMSDVVVGLRQLVELRRQIGERQQCYRRWALEHRERSGAWQRAASAIESSPHYAGLRLDPQVGLVPLGPDARTGLWLFGVAGTGRMPAAPTALTDETAVVLVLIPAGHHRIGARSESPSDQLDPQAFSHEGPDHEVSLRPFFIARTEMTQHQWYELTGARPSHYGAGHTEADRVITARHPVEGVSWDECARELSRIGLVLPSEVQWEAATRGGRRTVYWTGNEPAGLERAENIADALAKRVDPGLMTFEAWDDGHFIHAPVGSFPDGANPFGLLDVHGNVREWCRDAYDARAYDRSADDLGDRAPTAGSDVRLRVYRGGSWGVAALHARASYRFGYAPALHDSTLGVRPCRLVTTARSR